MAEAKIRYSDMTQDQLRKYHAQSARKSYYKNIEKNRTSQREAIAAKRASDPEFRERQLKAKRDWYKKNATEYKFNVEVWRSQNRHRLTTYGRKSKYRMTQEQFDTMFAEQGKRCAICRSESTGWKHGWHVDHDHACCPGNYSCGKCVRGILCQGCNHLLARSKENPETLSNAIRYLAKNKKCQPETL